ncbi:hypothetical protein BS78_10G255700 [Paspalum vaginatum]|nr:hypothetical protein BS78_10G255700 [Paspalum vaginatum]
MKMAMPCAGFLTDASVSEPSPACCRGLRSVADDGGTICFCNVGNGDVAKLLPAPMNSTRMFSLPVLCNFNLRLEPLAHCNRKPFDLIKLAAASVDTNPLCIRYRMLLLI